MKNRPQITAFHGGRVIWVYKHLRTHQVVYSLRQSLRGPGHRLAMDQLPFLGKKTRPAAIRGDLWRPYCRIEFSPGKEWLGLLAYRKLRECNTLRYTSWDRQGGGLARNREERAFDLMDQRATSVADIAKVLEESRGWTTREAKIENTRTRQKDMRLQALWSRMQKTLDPARCEATLAQIEDRLSLLNEQLNQGGDSPELIGRLRKEVVALKANRNFHTRSAAAMQAIRGEDLSSKQWADLPKDFRAIIELHKNGGGAVGDLKKINSVVGKTGGTSEEGVQAKPTNIWDSLTKGFSGLLTPSDRQVSTPRKERPNEGEIPLPLEESELTELSSHSLGSVRIGWDDLRDAQWAVSWPQTVLHEPLGFLVNRGSSRVFPSLAARPIMDMTPQEEVIMNETKLDGEVSEEGAADETEAPSGQAGERGADTVEDPTGEVKSNRDGDGKERDTTDRLATGKALSPSKLFKMDGKIENVIHPEAGDGRESNGANRKEMSGGGSQRTETADTEPGREEVMRVRIESQSRPRVEAAQSSLARRLASKIRENGQNESDRVFRKQWRAASAEERRLMLINAEMEQINTVSMNLEAKVMKIARIEQSRRFREEQKKLRASVEDIGRKIGAAQKLVRNTGLEFRRRENLGNMPDLEDLMQSRIGQRFPLPLGKVKRQFDQSIPFTADLFAGSTQRAETTA